MQLERRDLRVLRDIEDNNPFGGVTRVDLVDERVRLVEIDCRLRVGRELAIIGIERGEVLPEERLRFVADVLNEDPVVGLPARDPYRESAGCGAGWVRPIMRG